MQSITRSLLAIAFLAFRHRHGTERNKAPAPASRSVGMGPGPARKRPRRCEGFRARPADAQEGRERSAGRIGIRAGTPAEPGRQAIGKLRFATRPELRRAGARRSFCLRARVTPGQVTPGFRIPAERAAFRSAGRLKPARAAGAPAAARCGSDHRRARRRSRARWPSRRPCGRDCRPGRARASPPSVPSGIGRAGRRDCAGRSPRPPRLRRDAASRRLGSASKSISRVVMFSPMSPDATSNPSARNSSCSSAWIKCT